MWWNEYQAFKLGGEGDIESNGSNFTLYTGHSVSSFIVASSQCHGYILWLFSS